MLGVVDTPYRSEVLCYRGGACLMWRGIMLHLVDTT